MGDSRAKPRVGLSLRQDHERRALAEVRNHLKRWGVKLLGFLLVVYAVLKLIPALEQALHTLEQASWQWVLALVGLEVLSEAGFVLAWSAIVDPQNVLGRDGRGRRMDEHVAWAQLGGGLLLPGGSWGGAGLGGVILHRFGMPTKLIAERQFNLSMLNTATDALALVVFGLGLAIGILLGEDNLLLTLLPAVLAGAGIAAAVLIAPRASALAKRLEARHAKTASAITTLAAAVEDTKRLFRRGAWKTLLGIAGYLVFDVLVLWCAFLAMHVNAVPAFPVVIMAYIVGALGGSLPLPAAAGTIGGIAGMLIVYGVVSHTALAAVLLHQAIGLLVPLIGGAIAYAILRHRFGPIRLGASNDPIARQSDVRGG
jgi:uncharacterized membrane protein YbhN (UPF0104 family)